MGEYQEEKGAGCVERFSARAAQPLLNRSP